MTMKTVEIGLIIETVEISLTIETVEINTSRDWGGRHVYIETIEIYTSRHTEDWYDYTLSMFK